MQSLAGLALMILSIIVLLLRFATYLGQVQWAQLAARPLTLRSPLSAQLLCCQAAQLLTVPLRGSAAQVRARWAARPALQLYAAHREEVALRRRMRAGGRPMPTAHTYSF